MAAGIASAATFLVALAVLVATALAEDRAVLRLARLRIGCAASATALVAASLAGAVSGLALGAACVALVLSVHAIWLAMRAPAPEPLRSVLDRLAARGDDAWSHEFERPFREYARKHRANR